MKYQAEIEIIEFVEELLKAQKKELREKIEGMKKEDFYFICRECGQDCYLNDVIDIIEKDK